MSAFQPARSKLEAVSRLSALTHSPPERLGPGSKERKSVLVNLAVGLGLDVDASKAKPELGRQISAALGVEWNRQCWSAGQTITLRGLNNILDGAEAWTAKREATRLESDGPFAASASGFVPARSKLEAVSRLSALTHSPPERLGPGSKERKSVLVNLAVGLGLDVDASKAKPELGRQISAALGVEWNRQCWSAGQTITLDGLNNILRGAESRVAHAASANYFTSVRDEASALVTALVDSLPQHMDGRACVRDMQAADFSQWAQDEWVAFFFEYVGLPALINAFGGGPRRIGATQFDYGLGRASGVQQSGVRQVAR
jgi:hypothetical protein